MKPIILVVDDSDFQRQIIGGLLKHAFDYDICFAWDGQDACDYLEKSPADIVLTDLLMPGIDGLALIDKLRIEHPDIPVALVTAHGNEEVAEDALRRGAVNYIPKAELSERLLPIVQQMVHRVQFDQETRSSVKRSQEAIFEESIASDPSLIEPLVDRIHAEMLAADTGDRTDRVGTCIALTEALSNAVLHGNLEITRDDLAAAQTSKAKAVRERVVQEKMASPALAKRRVTLQATISGGGATFVIRDESSRSPARPDIAVHTEDFLQRGHARGLVLMQSLTDSLQINPAANEVKLVAKLAGKRFNSHVP